jgi:hypothetical protein
MSSRSTQIIGGPDREHAFVDTATNALLVKVVNPSSGGSNVNIAEVGGTAIGSTVPISDGGGSITVDGSLTATFGGLVSTGNATATPLGSNATFTGVWEEVVNYSTLTIVAYANVASATGGWKLQWSTDGTNVDKEEGLTLNAAAGRALALNVRARYFRTVYTNGASAQSTFRIGTVYRPSGMGANNYTLTGTLYDTTLAIMTRSVIVGETTGGGGGYHNVKVTPSGALTVEINDGGGSITVDGTVAVSSVSGTVTVGDGGGSLTVDGTVAATQSGAWTVSVNEPVSVDDNGGSLTVDGTVAVSSVGGTVVVGDGGGSLTVYGTVAATQSGSWTVSVNEPVSVDDNGGSLTVDGTVAVSSVSGSVTVAQATHNNLNLNANIQVADVDVGNANPVPVSDAGGSLTVDGTVAATQSGAWTVSVNEPVSVDDNGGSLTVDGTVTAAQATHDNLNLNANLQVNNTDVSNSNRVPISDGGGSITVDGNVNVDGSSVVSEIFSTPTGNSLEIYAQNVSVPVASIGIAPLFQASSDPGLLGIAADRWTHGFIEPSGGGLYVYNAGGTVVADVSNVVPGTASNSLGKAEDTAHTSGSTGVMPLAVRNDSMTVFAGPNGDYIPFSTDAVGRLQVIKSGGKATYRAATTNNVVAAAGASIFFVLAGSSTKTITVQRVIVTCPTLTAVAYTSVILEKFSSAPTGGTATTLTKVPLDSSSAASTANLCQVYTAAPTEGTLVGAIGCQRSLFQATTAAAAGTPPDPITWDFRNGFGEASGVVLRGTAENIGLAFGAAPATAVTVGVEVEWIEE